jgi:hypothetical protein
MRIFAGEPSGWKELEEQVARIFRDMGFAAELQRCIETVRGVVEVDVLAMSQNLKPRQVYLCECKYWRKRVPKTVVHSFRTVVNDFGANFGIIISRAGFQKGAEAAAHKTNVLLLDWAEFEEMFYEEWWEAVTDELDKSGLPLRDYTDFLDSQMLRCRSDLAEQRKAQHDALQKAYHGIAMMTSRLFMTTFFVPRFPYRLPVPDESRTGHIETTCDSPFELIEALNRFCRQGIAEFDGLFGMPARKKRD